LTPVTLGLGGKSPAIIFKDCYIKHTAKRLVWGKFINACQTCVAPDYIYVHMDIYPKLIKQMKKQHKGCYAKNQIKNEDYGKIINQSQYERLKQLLEVGTIITGGESDAEQLKIPPTLIEEITWYDPIMQDEIFGPILPIMSFKHI